MGFSMMSPTYVSYKEKFKRSQSGIKVQEYDKKFTGFFGNCRSLFGMQVPLSDRWKFGSEIVFAYFNEIKSGDIADEGFVVDDQFSNKFLSQVFKTRNLVACFRINCNFTHTIIFFICMSIIREQRKYSIPPEREV